MPEVPDGRVYLGLGGREFRLDSRADDYERGSWREYVLGQGPVDPLPPPQTHVTDPEFNDPRKGFPLDTVNLTRSPVYVRFEPDGDSPNWNLAFAAALVYAPQFVVAYTSSARAGRRRRSGTRCAKAEAPPGHRAPPVLVKSWSSAR